MQHLMLRNRKSPGVVYQLAAAAGARILCGIDGTAGTPRCMALPANATGLIKDLRERSGAPISHVKACLQQCGWDADAAYDALRKKGLAAAAKKASRHAAEGLVGLSQVAGTAAVVEINSETDFVSRSDLFQRLVATTAAAAAQLPWHSLAASAVAGAAPTPAADSAAGPRPIDSATLAALPLPDTPTAGDGVGGSSGSAADAAAALAAKVRENIVLRRGFLLASPGVIGTYIHTPSATPGTGRIASLVALESSSATPWSQQQAEQLTQLGCQLAMHVAGMKPAYLERSAIPAEVLESERGVLLAAAQQSGKPAAVLAKVVEGRLAKWCAEVCLLEQRFVLDDSVSVRQLLQRTAAALGLPKEGIRLGSFLRLQVGEGVGEAGSRGGGGAKKDFAAEVADMARGGGSQ